jgi:DNA-directed RNA polymerase subunit M/transcription elongation factor TFIIS
LPGEPKRLEHPRIVYLIGFIFKIVTLTVLGVALYHITFSPHGPAVLIPLEKKLAEKRRSAIMEEMRIQEEYEVHRHFHNIVAIPELPENLRPVCYICHSDYPHSKNKKVRALLNMHTEFFVCETCHIEEKVGAEIVYTWYNPIEQYPKGPFFGTSYDPETGNLLEVEDHFSKIAPYYSRGDKLESAIQAQDAPLAQDYMRVRDKLTPEQRDNVKKKFHVSIKEKGAHECKICHAKKGLLDFRKLGFADNRIVDLEQLNVKGMLTKYEQFYLPNLFK